MRAKILNNPKEKINTGKPIKTAILCDPFGCLGKTMEEETIENVEFFDTLVAPRKIAHYCINALDDSAIKPGTELILFDFGGMTMGNHLMEDNSRDLLKWANDNPSVLIVVVSSFTYRQGIKPELDELGLDSLPNVIEGTSAGYDQVEEWFKQ